MTSIGDLIPFTGARTRLLGAAEARGALLSSYAHPRPGPDGESLATDVARFGAPVGEADRVVVITSGVHGVEGHAGNGLQLLLVESGRLEGLPTGVAVVLVHAVNPYGMAWSRRVDHDNIDVNRNFVDPGDLPTNPMYGEVDGYLNPTAATFDVDDLSFLDGLQEFWARVGDLQAMRTLNGGQYSHPAGVQFGGQHVSWSRRTLEAIWTEQLGGARQAIGLDVHTGLGPEGRLTVFQTADEHEEAAALGVEWYPTHLYRADRTEEDPIDHGLLGPGFDAWAASSAPGLETATFVLEFGTLDPIKGITAFRADNWLHHHGDPADATGAAIAQLMRDQFFIADAGWRGAVAEQGLEAVHTALDGLT
jgi:hypothetical protein